jgi:outer membrane murein-binding lipoprotein Lpp
MKKKYLYALCVMSLVIASVQAAQQEFAPMQQQQKASTDIQSLSQEIRELTNKVNILAFGHACNAAPAEQANKNANEQKTYILDRAALDKANVTIVNSNVFVIGRE